MLLWIANITPPYIPVFLEKVESTASNSQFKKILIHPPSSPILSIIVIERINIVDYLPRIVAP